MKPALTRTPLPVKLADLIEQQLRRGQWAEGLPGYRRLAAEFEVSWRTAIAALKLVEARGLLQPQARGRSRAPVAAATRPSGPQGGNLLILWAAPHTSDLTLRDEIHAFTAFWEKHRGRAHIVTVDYARRRRPASLLRSLREKHRAVAVVLAIPPAAWIRAALEVALPVYCLGGEQTGIPGITGDGYPIVEEIESALRNLRALGHRRILIPSSPGSDRMLDCIRAAMVSGSDGDVSPEDAIRFCPVFQEDVPAVWQNYWADTFAALHPTAVICLHEKCLLSLYGFCAARGLRIPQDVSVLCMVSSESLEWCHPRPVCMRYPDHQSIARFKSWVRGGCQPAGFRKFRLQEMEGGSIVPQP